MHEHGILVNGQSRSGVLALYFKSRGEIHQDSNSNICLRTGLRTGISSENQEKVAKVGES